MRVQLSGEGFVAEIQPWERERIRQAPEAEYNRKSKIWALKGTPANAKWLLKEAASHELDAPSKAFCQKLVNEQRANPGKQFPADFPFKTDPMQHQLEALHESYARKEKALFMEMGTGKTWVAIQLMSQYHMEDSIDFAVVICPTGVKPVWEIELQKHAPVEVSPFVLNAGKYKEFKEWAREAYRNKHTQVLPVLVMGVEALSQGNAFDEVTSVIKHFRYMAVLDESSSIKNWKSKRSESCWEIGGGAEYSLIMTGTPITQGIPDLFSQFWFLNWQIIGKKNYYAFRSRYVIMGGYKAKQEVGYQNVGELLDILKPHVFVRRKKDVLDLPEKQFQSRVVEPSPAQTKALRELKDEFETIINGQLIETEEILERMTRYQQICGGFYPVPKDGGDPDDPETEWTTEPIPGKNPKMDELINVINEVEGKVIIWARYIAEIQLIIKALSEKYGPETVVHYYGETTDDERRDHTVAFQDPDSPARFMVANQTVGGMGVTWTAATNTIYYSNTFSYQDRAQSEDRNHRKGQTETVNYVDIYLGVPQDLMIKAAQERKQSLAEYVTESIS